MEPITKYIEERHEFGGMIDPGKPLPGIMQVFYEDDIPRMVDFLCPCGCGSNVPTHLNNIIILPHHWNYSPGPTLSPSIRFMSGCKAHFNIINGNVIMHADSGK